MIGQFLLINSAVNLKRESGLAVERAILFAATLGTVAIAWLVLAQGDWTTHSTTALVLMPHAPPAGMATLLSAWLAWIVMMVAMMLPTVVPWVVLLHAAHDIEGSRTRSQSFGATGLFVVGYLVSWAFFGLLGAVAQIEMQRAGLLARNLTVSSYLGGVLLLGAGIYQLTPLKSACLEKCRSPIGFFLSHWRDGPIGAWRMGIRHGIVCMACCWGLMVIAFVFGVMNVLWMAVLALMVCLEKLSRRGATLGRSFGVGLVGWGIWLIVAG